MARARPRVGQPRKTPGAQSFGPDWLAWRMAQLLPRWPDVRLCVALSGGLDSSVLLAALCRVRPRPSALRAIHIDHGLQPAARAWGAHCRRLARDLGVPVTVLRARVECPPGTSPEAAARERRYGLLAEHTKSGEVLLTAHQQDDQLETVLLQLLRGSGLPGLSAMPDRAPFGAGSLLRPLLPCARAELESWARAAALTWVEDGSNRDEHFDRNYLRRRVLPVLRARWPGAAPAVARSAAHVAEAQSLLDELGRADMERASVGRALSAAALRALPPARRRNALRHWLGTLGVTVPDTARLRELAGPVLEAREDAQPELRWGEVRVRRSAGLLQIGPGPLPPPCAPPAVTAHSDESQRWRWREAQPCTLPDGSALVLEADPRGPIDLDLLPQELEVRRRRGGERLRLRPGGPSRLLKSLLQEAKVPPSERKRLPLVCAADAVLLVADRWVDSAAQASSASRRRGRVRWLACSRVTPEAGRSARRSGPGAFRLKGRSLC